MKVIAKSKYLEFKSASILSDKEWNYVRRTNDTNQHDSAVVITTIVKKDNKYHFLLFKTFRPPLIAENKSKYCLESPAGLIGDIDKNEDVIACAKKELLEEAGLVADDIFIELENSATSAGLSSETLCYVTAFVNDYQIKHTPEDDGGIIQERFLVECSEIIEYLKKINTKEISVAAATICGIFYAMARLNK